MPVSFLWYAPRLPKPFLIVLSEKLVKMSFKEEFLRKGDHVHA
jgi:hypothetical protein